MTFSFLTLGCKLNFAESSALGKTLIARGHTRAIKGSAPDLCIVNTCSVTDAADHKDRQAIRRLRRQYPEATLIVTGCYAQLKPGEIADIPGVDYVLGMHEKFDIPAFVEHLEQQHETIHTSEIREVDTFCGARSKDDRTRCFLKVQDGCNYFCTYCTIPLARGKSRNPSIATLTDELRGAIEEGAKEIVLTGVNIGDFGRSTGERFIDLLRALDDIEPSAVSRQPSGASGHSDKSHQPSGASGHSDKSHQSSDFRIRISSCEPNLLSDEVIDFVAHSRHFAPHFHIPLQSGSNEVLRIMHRRYNRELFKERVEHILRVMPQAFIGVDCMVGVRGETEECWEDYLDFIGSLPVSQLHVFTYSERRNTRMLEMDLHVVPQKERERRSQLLHRVSEEKLQAFYAAHRGERGVVLWEAKRVPATTEQPSESGWLMEGWTENYIRVCRPYDKAKINTFEEVVI
ncbi:MAG: radical SAM protein [Paludibacteraceae bacterium]|nr:radical SAM protein [Paludibacteraceae bacterium]